MMRTTLLLTTALALVTAPLPTHGPAFVDLASAAAIELAQTSEADAAAKDELKKRRKGAAEAEEELQGGAGVEQPAAEEAEQSAGENRRKRPKGQEAEPEPQPKAEPEQAAEPPAQEQAVPQESQEGRGETAEQPAAEETEQSAGEKRRKRPKGQEAEQAKEPQPKAEPEQAAEPPAQEQAVPQESQEGQGETAEQPAAEETEQSAGEKRRKRPKGQEAEPEPQPKAEPEQAAEPPAQEQAAPQESQEGQGETAEQPAPEMQEEVTVSEDAEQPKQLATEPIAEQIEKASEEAIAVVPDKISKEDRARLEKAEAERRRQAKRDRAERIGAAAAGVAVGALVPMLGGRIVGDEGDRFAVERNGELIVRKDESALLRRDGEVQYERLKEGRIRETIVRPDGTRIVTVRDAGGFVLRRLKILPNGDRIILFDWREDNGRRHVDYDRELPPIRLTIALEQYIVLDRHADRHLIYETFAAPPVEELPQVFTLQEVRENQRVREFVRRVDLDTITFDTGSAEVRQSQVPLLGDIAGGMLDVIDRDPGAVFLVEGHTDAVGSDLYNLFLSDRRAETVARILVDAYGVPPENLVTEGYGEQYLKIDTQLAERANRRVTVRNITPLVSSENR